MPPGQRVAETAVSIAYLAGESSYHSSARALSSSDYIQFAEEFEAKRRVDEDGNETYDGTYYENSLFSFTYLKLRELRERAGEIEIPPDNDGRNGERANWAFVALGVFEGRTGTDREDYVADLLCDLMHWCDRNGQEFHHQLNRAKGMYGDEILPPGLEEETSEEDQEAPF